MRAVCSGGAASQKPKLQEEAGGLPVGAGAAGDLPQVCQSCLSAGGLAAHPHSIAVGHRVGAKTAERRKM